MPLILLADKSKDAQIFWIAFYITCILFVPPYRWGGRIQRAGWLMAAAAHKSSFF
jgi:hypothetical protein